MGKLTEEEKWEISVKQVENGEPVDGGESGPVVEMARGLANRTLWLKKKLDELGHSVQNLEVNLENMDLTWDRILNKPEKYPPEEHYHEGLVPVGGIIGWTKSTAPTFGEWTICNGTNGTPDLRDRFIVGVGNKYRVGDTGGAESVSLNELQIGKHSHKNRVYGEGANGGGQYVEHAYNNYPMGRTYANSARRGLRWASYNHENSNEIVEAGEGQPHENRPPYYALYFIMRIK